MAYRAPDFNTLANVWTASAFPGVPRLLNIPCQLRSHEHITVGQADAGFARIVPLMALLTAAGTDIHDYYSLGGHDIIECPAGTNRFYECVYVDDVARDFPNEYRMALMSKHGAWPTPTP